MPPRSPFNARSGQTGATITWRVDPQDLRDLQRFLDQFDDRIVKKSSGEAARRALKRIGLPELKDATPVSKDRWGQGKRGQRKKTHRGGNLRKSAKVMATKRSRRWRGAQVIFKSKDADGFYGKFVELGRTFNMFKGKALWALVPDSWKGRGNRLWRPGHFHWLVRANRIERRQVELFRKLLVDRINVNVYRSQTGAGRVN